MIRLAKTLIGLALVAVVGVGAFSLFSQSSFFDDAVDQATTSVTNAAIDASGIKETIQKALDANAESIASALGVSVQDARGMISNLDVASWQATSLPSDAQASGSYSASFDGTSANITTYENPSYITVEAYGQSLTLSVPESAQEYVPYLAYLQ